MRTARNVVCLALAACSMAAGASAGDATLPQTIHIRYEAVDPGHGGDFVIWLDRETIHNGVDSHLFPTVRFVDVTYFTPSQGSPPIVMIETAPLNSHVSEFYNITGPIRFKVSGMRLTETNIPK